MSAFISLNRELVLKNLRMIYPSIYTVVRNSFKSPSDFFIDTNIDNSLEGTAQDDPIAMAMFGGVILTLFDMLEDHNMTQRRYADYGNSAGSFQSGTVVLYNFNSSDSTVDYNVVTSHLTVTRAEIVQKSN